MALYIPMYTTYGCILSFHIAGIALSVYDHKTFELVIYDPILLLFGRLMKCMFLPLFPKFQRDNAQFTTLVFLYYIKSKETKKMAGAFL